MNNKTRDLFIKQKHRMRSRGKNSELNDGSYMFMRGHFKLKHIPQEGEGFSTKLINGRLLYGAIRGLKLGIQKTGFKREYAILLRIPYFKLHLIRG